MTLNRIPFLIISIICLLYGFKLYFEFIKLKQNGIKTLGKIIDVKEKYFSSSDFKTLYYFPIIEFYDKHGKRHIVESEIGSGSKTIQSINNKVEIFYNSENPEDALLKKDVNLKFPLVCFFLSLIFGLIGVL